MIDAGSGPVPLEFGTGPFSDTPAHRNRCQIR